MIMDKQLIMSSNQSFTAQAEAISTNVLDFGALGLWDNGIGTSVVELIVRVSTLFTSSGAATLVVLVETDGDEAFGSAIALHTTATLALAAIEIAGATLVHMRLPITTERYIRCTYTIGTADATAGAVDAFIVLDSDTNIA